MHKAKTFFQQILLPNINNQNVKQIKKQKEKTQLNFKTKDFEEYDQPFLLNKFRKLLDKEHAYGPGDIHYKLFNHLPVSALQTLLDLMNDIW